MDCGQEFASLIQLQTHQLNAHPSQPKKPQRKCAKQSTLGGATADATSTKSSRPEDQEVDPLWPVPNMLPLGDDALTTAV